MTTLTTSDLIDVIQKTMVEPQKDNEYTMGQLKAELGLGIKGVEHCLEELRKAGRLGERKAWCPKSGVLTVYYLLE